MIGGPSKGNVIYKKSEGVIEEQTRGYRRGGGGYGAIDGPSKGLYNIKKSEGVIVGHGGDK